MSTTIQGPGAAAPATSNVIEIDADSDKTIEEQFAAQPDKLVAVSRPTTDDELFDGKQYQVKATIDGEDADKIQVGFSGTWVLDPNVPRDVAFFESLKLGRTVTLQIEAEVSGKTAKHKRNDKDEETVTGVATLKVVDVYQPSPEELA